MIPEKRMHTSEPAFGYEKATGGKYSLPQPQSGNLLIASSSSTDVLPIKNENWEKLYRVAAIEVDGKKMPERVAAVREAIRGRLQDLEHSSDHHAERLSMDATLKILSVLEAESQRW